MDINLEKEMKADKEIIALCGNDDTAQDFYRALCNMRWRKIGYLREDEKIIDRLKGNESDLWSCSWRYAGSIIADIRNEHHGKNEDYMAFYCSGNEGHVADIVDACFNKIGWEQCPWPPDNNN